jgi:hypothetical protein
MREASTSCDQCDASSAHAKKDYSRDENREVTLADEFAATHIRLVIGESSSWETLTNKQIDKQEQ